MHPLPFTYPYAIAFWVVFVATFIPEWLLVAKVGRSPATKQDKGSTGVIVWGNTLGMTLCFVAAYRVPAATFATGRIAAFWAGVLLIVIGALMRQHCFRTLGVSFRPTVKVEEKQAVVERGLYRWIRHPSYLAGLVLFLGIAVALTNWASVAIVFVMFAAVYGYRIHVEERALVETIGEPYRDYMRRTWRLVPFIF